MRTRESAPKIPLQSIKLCISIATVLASQTAFAAVHSRQSDVAVVLEDGNSQPVTPGRGAAGIVVRTNPAEDSAELARLNHARELMGKYYRKKFVRPGQDSTSDMREFVRQWVDQALVAKDRGAYKKRTHEIAQTILVESHRYGLDPIFLIAVIESESSFSPRAQGTQGEIGLMQLMPNTAKWIAHRFQLSWQGRRSLYDPVANIRIGAAYLAFLRSQFDFRGRLYLSAYNMGSLNVKRALASNVTPKDYASRVMEHYLWVYNEFSRIAN